MDAAQAGVSSFLPKLTKNNHQPTAVVAGGAGFLGSHLCETLLTQNCAVICLDDLSAGSRENIKNLLIKPDFLFFEGDINKEIPVLPEGIKVDYVFHLAGVEKHLDQSQISLETLLVNSIGTRNLLELARKHEAKFLLVSSDDFTQGPVTASSLAGYFGSSQEKEQEITYQQAKRYAEALVFEYSKNYHLDVRVARVLDVYGPRMSLLDGVVVADLLKQILEGDQLKIAGDGLKVIHPTYVTDVIFGVVKAMFSSETNGGIFHLINPQKTTILGLAEAFKKAMGRDYEVVFTSKDDECFNYYYPQQNRTQEVLNWQPKVSLADGLEKTIDYFKNRRETPSSESVIEMAAPVSSNADNVAKPNPTPETPKISLPKVAFNAFFSKPKLPVPFKSPPKVGLPQPHLSRVGRPHLKTTIFFSTLALVVLGLFSPLLSLGFHFYLGNQQLSDAGVTFKKTTLEQAFSAAENAEASFRAAKADLSNTNWLFQLTIQKPLYQEASHLLYAEENLASAVKYTVSAAKPLYKMAEILNKNIDQSEVLKSLETELTQAKTEIENAGDFLSLAEATIAQLSEKNLPSWVAPRISELTIRTQETRQLASGLKEALLVAPKTLGFKGPVSYLLLFQDSADLKPGGGAIRSYGLLNLEGGKVKELVVDDVSKIDAALKEKVEPPAEIKKYRAQEFWSFQEANWNPRFGKASQDLEWFFEKETGKKVDGVIALDTVLLKRLLQAVGEVEMTDYQEKVNSGNVLEKLRVHEGATDKKDFLGSLGETLLNKVFTGPENLWPFLMVVFQEALEERHLLVSTHDPSLTKVLTNHRWAGQINSLPTGSASDYLMVVDASMGESGSSSLIKTVADYQVVLGQGSTAEAKLKLTYRSEAIATGSAIFKDYVRVYAPVKAQFLKIESEEGLKVKVTEEEGRSVFGFYFELMPGQTKDFTLSYTLPLTVKVGETYSLWVQKQPGRDEFPFSFDLKLPETIKATETDATSFTGNLRRDREFIIETKEP